MSSMLTEKILASTNIIARAIELTTSRNDIVYAALANSTVTLRIADAIDDNFPTIATTAAAAAAATPTTAATATPLTISAAAATAAGVVATAIVRHASATTALTAAAAVTAAATTSTSTAATIVRTTMGMGTMAATAAATATATTTTTTTTALLTNEMPTMPMASNADCAAQMVEQFHPSLFDIQLAVPEWEALLTAIVLTAIILLTVVGNILVILSVFTYKPLRIVQNFFIVSLAVADLTVALLVLPFNVAYSILGRWEFGIHMCKMWLTCDIMCCTSSILNLCAIALDRYWAITDPINYAQKRTVGRVLFLIAGVWLLSLLISSPPLLGWNDWPEEFTNATPCELNSDPGYVIYSSLGSFFIPLAIMTIVYVEIYIATRRRLRERAKASKITTIALKTSEYDAAQGASGRGGMRCVGAGGGGGGGGGFCDGTSIFFNCCCCCRTNARMLDMTMMPTDQDSMSSETAGHCNHQQQQQHDGDGDDDDDDETVMQVKQQQQQQQMQIIVVTERKKSRRAIIKDSIKHGKARGQKQLQQQQQQQQKNAQQPKRQSIKDNTLASRTASVDEVAHDVVAASATATATNAVDVSGVATYELKANVQSSKSTNANTNSTNTSNSNSHGGNDVSQQQQTAIPGGQQQQKHQQQQQQAIVNVTASTTTVTTTVTVSATATPTATATAYAHISDEGAIESTISSSGGKNDNSDEYNSSLRNPSTTSPGMSTLMAAQAAGGGGGVVVAATASSKKSSSSGVYQFIEEKQKISLSKERRAARTLGIIMGVFVICWLPFFLMYVILPFCSFCCPTTKFKNFITWLGYINSGLNPIIYTIFNLDYRRAFKKLLGIN